MTSPVKSQHTQIVSVVVPVYNEVLNVRLLCQEITAALETQPRPFDLIMVDDGSTDGTADELRMLAQEDPRIKLVLFRRNFGQTAAMHAGIQFSDGDVIVTIDGDLQNDPEDIPRMLEKFDEGYDLVHGWRKDRQDAMNRKLPSRIANWLISHTTDFPIHDLGCTLKVMDAGIAKQLELYGEMHRFIPVLAHRLGARSVEVVTNHRARQFGETKYGLGRTFRVVLDLITVKYLLKYFESPMKLFGKLGLVIGASAVLALLATLVMKLAGGTDMTGNPCLILGVLGAVLSVQFFSLGLIGEVCARIYYSQSHLQTYQVRELINIEPPQILGLDGIGDQERTVRPAA